MFIEDEHPLKTIGMLHRFQALRDLLRTLIERRTALQPALDFHRQQGITGHHLSALLVRLTPFDYLTHSQVSDGPKHVMRFVFNVFLMPTENEIPGDANGASQ